MRRLLLLLVLPCLLLIPAALLGSTPLPNPADYTVTIHVVSSRVEIMCAQSGSGEGCYPVLHFHATIDGQKYELQGEIKNDPGPAFSVGVRHQNFTNGAGFLALGDYKAKLVPGNAKDPNTPYYIIRNYEMIFPDGRLAEFQVVGQSE